MSAVNFSPFIEKSCNSIIQNIRSSPLNFSLQETPFSIYITVRKSVVKTKIHQDVCQNVESELSPEPASALKTELDSLNRKVKFLEEANNGLKKDYEEAVVQNEEYLKHNAVLDDKP